MTIKLGAVPAAKQTGDEEFFKAAMAYRNLHDEVEELSADLNHFIGQRKEREYGALILLGQVDEISRLSASIDEKKTAMELIVSDLASKFYPTNPEVRARLNGVWIGVKPLTAIRFSEDLKSIEIRDLQQ